jgi:predicted nucleic acid-binding protein
VEGRGHNRQSVDVTAPRQSKNSEVDHGLENLGHYGWTLWGKYGELTARRTLIISADTSALGCAYLGDEVDANWICDVIFNGPDPVVICELVDVELASLLDDARSDHRIDGEGIHERLEAYQDHTADDGPIGVVPLTHEIVERAQRFVLKASLRTLDALHLAAAQQVADAGNDEITILTLDDRQARAAEILGFTLYVPTPK